MSSGFQVTPDDLRGSGKDLSATGGSLYGDVTALQSKVTGDGSPWGDDEIGSMIGDAYVALTDYALQVYASYAEEVDGTGVRVQQAADNHADTETANADGVGAIEV
ncbi:WXG100 family type VII secretion target [Fodinicola acaciae]|uniref:WXG100 family type VII secretion target n=1 Tax=Fodinicola acaciae TaxID=2681555 RepID=UPI0013D2D461|nr:hypothetical protein [Fodinicola acaciae]